MMRSEKVFAGVLATTILVSGILLDCQQKQIERLEARVADVEHDNAIVLQTCRTTGQVCKEIAAKLIYESKK